MVVKRFRKLTLKHKLDNKNRYSNLANRKELT